MSVQEAVLPVVPQVMPAPAPWESAQVYAICEVLAQPTFPGLRWPTIQRLLLEAGVRTLVTQGTNKSQSLHRALMAAQQNDRSGEVVVELIRAAMNPTVCVTDTRQFDALREGLNWALRFKPLSIDEGGELHWGPTARKISEAGVTAERLRSELARRGTHPEAIRYCAEEFIRKSLFHAMFEACKGLSERLRELTGLTSDGIVLVNSAFSIRTGTPPIRINALMTETEIGDHRGLEQVIRGVFSIFRGNSAHLPRVVRPVVEQDALDLFSTLSYIHRRLDLANYSDAK